MCCVLCLTINFHCRGIVLTILINLKCSTGERFPFERVVKGGGLDHVSRKIKRSFHNSRNNSHHENHGSRRIKHLFLVSRISRFTASMEITIHQEKITHFTFHGGKKDRSRVTKIPLTTLI